MVISNTQSSREIRHPATVRRGCQSYYVQHRNSRTGFSVFRFFSRLCAFILVAPGSSTCWATRASSGFGAASKAASFITERKPALSNPVRDGAMAIFWGVCFNVLAILGEGFKALAMLGKGLNAQAISCALNHHIRCESTPLSLSIPFKP